MARGYFRCLRHLPRTEIADAELLKQAFVMKFLDARQRRFDRRGAVRRHQIEDLDLIGLLARQGLLEDSLQVLRFVAASVLAQQIRVTTRRGLRGRVELGKSGGGNS